MLLLRPLARLLPALIPILTGCSKGPAWGSENAVIAAVDPALREDLEPVLRDGFEREVFTTRNEAVFEVTFASSEDLGEFRRWRRIVVVGAADEGGLAADLLGGADLAAARAGGVVAEVHDEWALRQKIWVVSGPTAEATVELARTAVDSLYQVLFDDYVAMEVAQMWVSGRDSPLFEDLMDEQGFGIVLPQVYRAAEMSVPPGTRTWYNENPRRVVSVISQESPVTLAPDSVLAMRRSWGAALFPGDTLPLTLDGTSVEPDSFAVPEPVVVGQATLDGRPAVRLQGVWHNATDRTSGVFVTYAVVCSGRLVFLDGNLFAPERPKLPYVIQFDQIFSTFRCAGA